MSDFEDPVGPPPLFFVHVMKTGGTSLIAALSEHYRGGGTYPDRRAGDAIEEKAYPGRLMEMDPERLRRIRFFAPHMPPWVADVVAPSHLTVTVLREPVARTVSHLRLITRGPHFPDDIEAVWADASWRAHLVDHQTQLFSEEPPDADAAARVPALTADDLPALRAALLRTMATGIGRPRPLTRDDLDAAKARLDGIGVVGTTDRLDLVAKRLSSRLGLEIPVPGFSNVTEGGPEVPASLLADIRDHLQLDVELYDHAVDRSIA